MAPQLIPETIPAGGSIFILWINPQDFFQKPPHANSSSLFK